MPVLSRLQYPVRLTVVGLLSAVTSLVFTGVVAVPAGTGTGAVLLLAVVLTDLLHEYSPDTPDPGDESQPSDGSELDLDTDSLLIDARRGDR